MFLQSFSPHSHSSHCGLIWHGSCLAILVQSIQKSLFSLANYVSLSWLLQPSEILHPSASSHRL